MPFTHFGLKTEDFKVVATMHKVMDWKRGGRREERNLSSKMQKRKMVILRHFFLGCGMRKYLIKDLMIRRQDPQAKEGPFPETRFSPYCVHHLNS